jgi:hypothetical protein
MKYKIELTENFRPDKRSFYTPGTYRVPEDLSEELAEQAVNEGGAKRLESPAKFRPFFGKRPGIGKALGPAPENKAAVVKPRGRGRYRAKSDDGDSGSLPE